MNKSLTDSKTSQVVIVGAGPTGLTAANLLASYGISSIVLEKNDAPMDIPRAIVLDDEGARLLQVFGADKTYVDRTILGIGGKYYDDNGNCFSEVGTGPRSYGFEKKHYISQPEMEADLLQHANANELIDIRFGNEVLKLSQNKDSVTLNVKRPDGQIDVVLAPYVLACDGGRSPIRDALGIKMLGSTYRQDWIVLDARNDPDDARFSRFFCSSARPHVSIPAPHGGRRYEFMLLPGESHEQALSDDFVRDLVAPFRTLTASDLIRKTIYTFHARIAERFRKDRVLLLGDAAHLTPPFAGQGMNAGLRDAGNVAWKLASVLHGAASADILDSYDRERREPAWAMIQLAVAMGDIVMPVEPAKLAFREQLVAAMAPFPQVQDYFMQMRFKPKPRYDGGLFVDLDTPEFEASLVGEMIPQPMISGPEGEVLLDQVLGSGFALIAQDTAGIAALERMSAGQFAGFDLAKIALAWDADWQGGVVPRYGVKGGGLGRPLRTHRDQVMLIRPDRYCAGAFFPKDLVRGLTAMKKVLNA